MREGAKGIQGTHSIDILTPQFLTPACGRFSKGLLLGVKVEVAEKEEVAENAEVMRKPSSPH